MTTRHTIGLGALLSVSKAAEALGWRRADIWLRREGLVRCVDGRERVVWRQVLDRIGAGQAAMERKPRPLAKPMRMVDP